MQPTAAETTTTLTTARQSSHLLQLLRSILRRNTRDLKPYLARGGDPNARVYQARELIDDGRCYVSCEEYTGPGDLKQVSLLTMFSSEGWLEQAFLLIEAGADPNSDAGTSLSPMCTAASMADMSMMTLLQSRGGSIHCDGFTPLMAASEAGKLEAVKWLLDHGANITAAALVPNWSGDPGTTTAMLRAALTGHLDILRFLYAQGAPFAAETGGRLQTALHEAAALGHYECVRFILACGFPVDFRDSRHLTALNSASLHGRQEVMELLLNSGADIEARGDDHFTALMRAMTVDEPGTVTLLVTRGAVISDGGASVAGAQAGSIASLKALMTSPQWLGMSRTRRLRAEQLMLHYVKDKATLDAIRTLVLDMAPLIQHQNDQGNNALHSTARKGHPTVLLCALIKEGVHPPGTTMVRLLRTEHARQGTHCRPRYSTELLRTSGDVICSSSISSSRSETEC